MPFFKHFKDIKVFQEGHMGCVRRFRGGAHGVCEEVQGAHMGCVSGLRVVIWGV